jgi:endonuclease-3
LVKPTNKTLDVEKELEANIPKEQWSIFHHWLILHGRYTCTAKNPKHDECGLREVCKYYRATAK